MLDRTLAELADELVAAEEARRGVLLTELSQRLRANRGLDSSDELAALRAHAWPSPVSWVTSVAALRAHREVLPQGRFALSMADSGEALGDLPASPAFDSVCYLYLCTSQLGEEAARSLARRTRLELLSIEGALLPAAVVGQLTNGPLLAMVNELCFAHGAVDDATLSTVMASAQRATALDVYDCGIGSVNAIATSRCRLERLSLRSNPLGEQAAAELAASPHPLNELDLTETSVGDRGTAAVAAAAFSLSVLGLGNAEVGDDGACALAAADALATLRTCLFYNNPRIGLRGLRALASSTSLAGVERFDLDGNGWTTAEHARILAESTLHPIVREEWRRELERIERCALRREPFK